MSIKHYFLLVVIVSLFPLVSFLFSSQLFHTHDGLVHLPRIAAYYNALSDGHFPVRWAGELNYGYGMPLFNFIYQLPYLISSLLVFLGLGLVNAFKITLALSFILSGVFMFLFAHEFFEDKKKAFLVTIFYQFATFRFVELLVRGSFGEVYTYTFLPLVLYGITRLKKKITYANILITACACSLLVISHNALSLVFFGIAFVFIAFFLDSWHKKFTATFSLFLGLLLSSFYWLPALLEHKYTYGNLFMKELFLSHFPPFFNFFIPNVTNNPSLYTEGIAIQVGLMHTLGLVLAVWLLFRKKINGQFKRVIIFSLFLTVIAFFFMQPISTVVWHSVSLLRQFQFPWRFLGIIVFTSSLLSVSYLSYKILQKNSIYLAVIIITIFSSIGYWQASLGYDKVDESYYWNFPLNTTYYGETDVIWSAGPAKKYPPSRIEIIDGKGKVESLIKKNHIHTFKTISETPIKLVNHTQYFPGWRAFIDGQSTPIQFQDGNWRGEIIITVPQGIHEIRVEFQETKIRLISNVVSAITLIGLILLGIFKRFRYAFK